MLNKRFITLIFWGMSSFILAQNLVPNASFEQHTGCPDKFRQIKQVQDWWSPFGDPRYFHDCNNYETPYRKIIPPGEERYDVVPALPRSGKGYVGINVNGVSYPCFQDYLMTRLTTPLKKDTIYRVGMYVRLGDVWRYMEHLDVYFSKDKYPVSDSQVYDRGPKYKKYGQYERYSKRRSLVFRENITELRNDTCELKYRDVWVKIEGEYQAKGGEQFVMIGKFNGNRETWKRYLQPKKIVGNFDYGYHFHSYYFIDDVSVTKLPLQETRAYKAFANTIEPGKNIVFENIYFNTGEATLKATSFPALKLLFTYLQANKSYSLQIDGHTDNVGSAEANRRLSYDRAASILNYLVENGIDTTRIKAKGYGSQQPIADNGVAEGRQHNRRVEFSLH